MSTQFENLPSSDEQYAVLHYILNHPPKALKQKMEKIVDKLGYGSWSALRSTAIERATQCLDQMSKKAFQKFMNNHEIQDYLTFTKVRVDPLADTRFRNYLLKNINDPNVRKIFKLRFQGYSRKDVAAELGVSVQSIGRWIDDWVYTTHKMQKINLIEHYFKWLVGDKRKGSSGPTIPDVIAVDDTVYSLKSTYQLVRGITINPLVDCKPEFEYALAHNTTFTFVLAWPEKFPHLISHEVDPRNPHSFRINLQGNIKVAGRRI